MSMMPLRNLRSMVIPLVSIACSLQGPRIAWAAWEKQIEVSYELTRHGEVLPPSGIYMDIYYTGRLEVFAGEHENEIVVRVKLVKVTPTPNAFRQPESPEAGVLRTRFIEKSPVGIMPDELESLTIRVDGQAPQNVNDGAIVRIQVPDHAAWVDFDLRASPVPGHQVADFAVSRPYRDEPVRRVRDQKARDAELNALRGGKQVIEETCKTCKGAGTIRVPAQETTCPKCEGKGWYWRSLLGGGSGKRRQACEPPVWGICGGTGKATQPAHDERCAACDGKGKIRTVTDNPLVKPR